MSKIILRSDMRTDGKEFNFCPENLAQTLKIFRLKQVYNSDSINSGELAIFIQINISRITLDNRRCWNTNRKKR